MYKKYFLTGSVDWSMRATYLTVEDPSEMAQVVTLERAEAGRLRMEKQKDIKLHT